MINLATVVYGVGFLAQATCPACSKNTYKYHHKYLCSVLKPQETNFDTEMRSPRPRVLQGAAVFEHLPCVVGGSQTIQLKLQASILPNQQLTPAQVVLVPGRLEPGFQTQRNLNAQTRLASIQYCCARH